MISFDITGLWSVEDPDALFQSVLFFLGSAAFAFQLPDLTQWALRWTGKSNKRKRSRPVSIDKLETKFLSVFWLLRTSFWMSGPYFYSACASKMQNGNPLSVSTISQIALVGYISTPILGPLAGDFLSRKGPKVGSIIAAIFYGIGGLSLCSNSLPIMFLGRAFGGFGSSLMSSAPEAWLVAEAKRKDKDASVVWLRAIFGRAFQFDPILAILAGKLAGVFASYRGPTGPFEAQPLILGAAIGMILLLWNGPSIQNDTETTKQEKDRETLKSVFKSEVMTNSNVFLVGCIQMLFESAMNIFVLLWPPTMNAAIKAVYGETKTPFGSIFSCMMCSCLVGGLFFGEVSRVFGFNVSMISLMLCATLSMCLAAYSVATFDPEGNGTQHLIQLTTAFLIFEGCVGAYFPSIGILRCNHYGNGNLQLLLTLFQFPTNAIVAVVFVCLQSLGNTRALFLTCALLGLGTLSMLILRFDKDKRKRKQAVDKLKAAVKTTMHSFNSDAEKAKGEPEARPMHRKRHSRRPSLHEIGQDGLVNRASFTMPL
ncbi:unnamed protein product [Cylindrotheca closterium]|uniref:Molybdate-anion transporter n=1 Tax=Cylindrotheca closterium TaxID=2856 RepID=A0AAD2CQ43_9STRA|nr:unnamed protein product [Cylindrotheca closterium]